MTSDTQTLQGCLARYARRMHAVAGPRHHVASPLGAWLLLALAGPAASDADREALAEVLGCDVDTAARLAAELLERPHPLVASAAAAWTRPGAPLGPEFRDWQAALPGSVQTGGLPSQAELDAWARDHTFGLIDRFPLQAGGDPSVYLVLATALATRVSWERPFDLAPAAELGSGSRWAREFHRVLRSPSGPGHTQLIAVTPEAGDVAVQLATARDGLLVASVAAAADTAYGDVLAAAQRIACAYAAVQGRLGQREIDEVPRRRLADLPLGQAPLWRVREETSMDSAADQFTAVLPAWSASNSIDLAEPELGFGTAARALDPAGGPWQAVQSAMARYTRIGFEAAAVTGMAMFASARRSQPHRVADLRFAHPYAVVAVAVDPALSDSGRGRPRRPEPGNPWAGIPVFSAWVAEPEEAADDEPGPAR